MLFTLYWILSFGLTLSLSPHSDINAFRQRSFPEDNVQHESLANPHPYLNLRARAQEELNNSAFCFFWFSVCVGMSIIGHYYDNIGLHYLPWLLFIAVYRDDLGIIGTAFAFMAWLVSLEGAEMGNSCEVHAPLLVWLFIMGKLLWEKLPTFVYENRAP